METDRWQMGLIYTRLTLVWSLLENVRKECVGVFNREEEH